MTRGTQPGLRFRTRKLSPKQLLSVLREDEIESDEYKELLENQFKVETGVEKSEENEYHLQEALAGGSNAKKIVPAPPAEESSDIEYDKLYALQYSDPSTFIRFSQTVEECTGCQYDMTSDDDAWLTAFNQTRSLSSRLSEDDFEKIMEVFESTADHHTPFAAVDNSPVITIDVMETVLKQEIDDKAQPFGTDLYEYWKLCRQNSGNRALQPSLKFEMHQDSDDGDPYVCFRRRDVRQTRKTRARDIQSTEKLKRLRKELEDGRKLVAMSYDRELAKRRVIEVDRKIFEQRGAVKKIRQDKKIKVDDDDLINQKPQKRKPADMMQIQRGPGTQMHMTRRPDGRPLDTELTSLSEVLSQQENRLKMVVREKVVQFHKQNVNHIDLTREPLSPIQGQGVDPGFRHATTNYLMTPPQSSNSNSSSDHVSQSLMYVDNKVMRFPITPEGEGSPSRHAYRRRIGRGGRLWIDRRNLSIGPRAVDTWAADRTKYDQDDDNEEDVYTIDPYSIDAIRFRATVNVPSTPRRVQPELPSTNGQVSNVAGASPVARQISNAHPPQAPT